MAATKLSPRTRAKLKELGQRIRSARRNARISRNKLAERIGMLPTNYSRIEQGKMNVTVETLVRIAGGLDADLTIGFEPASKKG